MAYKTLPVVGDFNSTNELTSTNRPAGAVGVGILLPGGGFRKLIGIANLNKGTTATPGPATTDGLPEGTTNLYFTPQRVATKADLVGGKVPNSQLPAQLDPLTYPVMVGTQSLGYVGYPSLEAAASGAPGRPITVNVPFLVLTQNVTLTANFYGNGTTIFALDGVVLTLSMGSTMYNTLVLRSTTARVELTTTNGASVVPDASQTVQLVDSRLNLPVVFSVPAHGVTLRGTSIITALSGSNGVVYLYDQSDAPAGTGAATIVDRRLATASSAATGLPLTTTRTSDYTLALTDADKLVPVSSASAVTVTVPDHATVGFPIGTTLYVAQDGAGAVTIAGASGVVVQTAGGNKVPGQWTDVALHKRDLNTWVLKGGVQ